MHCLLFDLQCVCRVVWVHSYTGLEYWHGSEQKMAIHAFIIYTYTYKQI